MRGRCEFRHVGTSFACTFTAGEAGDIGAGPELLYAEVLMP